MIFHHHTPALFLIITLLLPLPLWGQEQPKPDEDPSVKGSQSDAESERQGSDDSNEEREQKPPRDIYNQAIDAAAENRFDAALTAFQEARDRAASDQSLRFNAAFNLGFSYAASADALGAPSELKGEKLNEAIQALEQSASWFRDALRTYPSDEDARINLEIVLKRRQVLVDHKNRSENTLEKSLDRLIENQREARQGIRLLTQSEPPDREFYHKQARSQRELLSQANEVADLATDESAILQNKAEEEQTDQEKLRLVQLQAMGTYLESARNAMASTRSQLRKIQGERAHRKSDQALRQLKRAREQLQDPLVILKAVYRDQVGLSLNTQQLLPQGDHTAQVALPSWLNNTYLSERQGDALSRSEELALRFEAIANSDPSELPNADPETARTIQGIREAAPLLSAALAAMEESQNTLQNNSLEQAISAQQRAIEALSLAIERFADLKSLIELTYNQQLHIAALTEDPAKPDPASEQADLSQSEREKTIQEGIALNLQRLERMAPLLLAEQEKVGSDPQQQLSQEELDQQRMRIEQAEQYRAQAADHLDAMQRNIKQLQTLRDQDSQALPPPKEANPDEGAAPIPLPQEEFKQIQLAKRFELSSEIWHNSTQAKKNIENLRWLFLSIEEHIEELAREQNDLIDATEAIAANPPPEEELSNLLGPQAEKEVNDAQFADQLADALRQRADTLANMPPGQAQQQQIDPQEMAQRFAAAGDEVEGAANAMRSASGELMQMPTNFDMSVQLQEQARDHLLRALELLQPPQQKPPQEQENQEQENQEQMSKEQAERRLQAIKDRQAERKKKKRPQGAHQPVEKDW